MFPFTVKIRINIFVAIKLSFNHTRYIRLDPREETLNRTNDTPIVSTLLLAKTKYR